VFWEFRDPNHRFQCWPYSDLGSFVHEAISDDHPFGRFAVPFSGFPFRQFSGVFLVPWCPDAIWLKQRACLTQTRLAQFSSSLRVPAGDRLVTPETSIYKQLKFGNMENRHLKIPHDTPPLRVFESRISRVSDFRVS
jgi:hypothetical protein